MNNRLILAIDQGTTGTTVVAFNQHGAVVDRAYSEFPQIYPKPGWVEHDAEVIWQTTAALVEQVAPGHEFAAVGITNQRETTVIWDRKTGEPIHNAIVWQCRRTVDTCKQLGVHAEVFRQKTGLVLDAYFSGTKIKWLLDHVPGARQRAQQGELLFGTIDSWLIWKLTRGAVHVTDYTNASRTLVYNIYERCWDETLLELLDIPGCMLPQVVSSSGEVGKVSSGRLAGVPIAGIAGDQQASLYGLHCFRPGLVKNTYGTGCFIMKYLGAQAVQSEHGLLTTLACDVNGQPAFALEGSVFTAAAAIQWLRDGLGIIEHAAQTEAMALALEDNAGVYFVPAFVGLGAPYWDSEARGTLVGLTAGVGRNHIARATLEAIAYQTRDVLEAMIADSGVAIQQVRADGGASANQFLMQFQADQLGIPLHRGSDVEKTAYGAAKLAARAVGFLPNQDPDADTEEYLFKPNMAESQRQQLYAGWRRAVKQARCQ